MMKVNVNINELFRTQSKLYEVLDRDASFMRLPDKGFHTVYETQFTTLDDYTITWAWIIGGYSNGCKYTVAVAEKDDDFHIGWVVGHKDYVIERSLPDELAKLLRFAEVKPLLFIFDVPGFEHTKEEPLSEFHFRDNGFLDLNSGYKWSTTSKFSIELPPMPCFEGAKAYSLKEGAYLIFNNDKWNYRLMSKFDYFTFGQERKPDYVFGDLFYIWKTEELPKEEWKLVKLPHDIKSFPETRESYDIVEAKAVYRPRLGLSTCVPYFIEGPAKLKGKMYKREFSLELPEGSYILRYVPGSSHPFLETRKLL